MTEQEPDDKNQPRNSRTAKNLLCRLRQGSHHSTLLIAVVTFLIPEKVIGVKLLGILHIEKIPCSRDAILHGAGGSIVAGLVHFLATSRVKRSCDVGMAGFVLTTLGSWFYCRYNNAKLRFQQKMIQDGIKNKVMYEGTSLDPTQKARDP